MTALMELEAWLAKGGGFPIVKVVRVGAMATAAMAT